MTPRRGTWMRTVMMIAVVSASGSARAEELRRDVVSNGVLIGAGAGAAAGAVISLATEDICSPGACAYLGGLTGAVIGLLVDRNHGDLRPVVPGSMIDDRLGDGALIGALSGVGVVLVDATLRCRPRPGRPPCTRGGILREMSSAAPWLAIVGLLIDAALPSRLPGAAAIVPERSHRRLGAGVRLRF